MFCIIFVCLNFDENCVDYIHFNEFLLIILFIYIYFDRNMSKINVGWRHEEIYNNNASFKVWENIQDYCL